MPRTSFSQYSDGAHGWLALPLGIVWLVVMLPFAIAIWLLGALIPDKPRPPR